MQHLQYNSPMQLYSREAAEEQYKQQSATVPNASNNAPIPLGGNDRHFDPSKSAALKAILDQEKQDEFGKNFFEKVAEAEAPNVPQQREPYWAGEARQKAERARSRSLTPGNYYQQYYYDDNFGIPSRPPQAYTTGPEISNNPVEIQQWHQQRQMRSPSRDRHHAPSVLASEKGYMYGGMDFVDHSHDQALFDNCYYESYPTKKSEKKELMKPGHNYGLDYSDRAQYIDDSDRGYYQGYGPQQPKLKPKYSADPHVTMNTYVVNSVEGVNPVRLVGDTLSNQKVPRETYLTDEEKRTFSTAYAPPPGFKRDHITVYPEPKAPEPICYSLSAKKRPQSTEPSKANQIGANPRSRTPDASNNDRWHYGNKEVNLRTLLTNEALRIVKRPEPPPEWADRRQLKHVNWANRVPDPKSMQVNPNWTKTTTTRTPWEPTQRVYQEQQPSWVNRSHVTKNAWQNTADRYGGPNEGRNQNYQYNETYSYQPSQNYSTNVQTTTYTGPQNGSSQNYVERTVYNSAPQNFSQHGTTTYSSQPYTQQPGSQNVTRREINTYNNPPSYAQQTGQYSIRTTYTTENEKPDVQSRTTYTYQTAQPQIQSTPGQVFTESSSTSKVENRVTESVPQPPQPPPRTSTGNQKFYEQQKSRNFERTTEERTVAVPAPPQPEGSRIIQQNDYNRYYKKTTTEQQGQGLDGRPVPASRSTTINTQKPEDFNRHTEMAETLPIGSISNSQSNAEGAFVDKQGHNISYRRELTTSADPGKESQLLKEEERRVVEESVEPGVISRHITTKFYKKKTVTDTSTTTQ
ncbi:hypothetical protein FO519_003268 [Halicephalobus sp. NKZ332]|nr:hypothetical protein FO519_003268 [Halicephalobus sp. NKZ332]